MGVLDGSHEALAERVEDENALPFAGRRQNLSVRVELQVEDAARTGDGHLVRHEDPLPLLAAGVAGLSVEGVLRVLVVTLRRGNLSPKQMSISSRSKQLTIFFNFETQYSEQIKRKVEDKLSSHVWRN